MGFVSQAVQQLAERRSATTSGASPASWLLDALGGGPTASGARVSEASAARQSTVFACVRTISEDVGRLPFPLYERLPRGRRRAIDHQAWRLLTTKANPELTAHAWRELETSHAALWGAGYAEIERSAAGRPLALWPLLPNLTRAVRKNGVKYLATKTAEGKDVVLRPGQYFHLPGPAWMSDGLDGDHPIMMARETIGLMMAASEFGARLFGNGARPSGILTSEKKLTKEQRADTLAGWNELVGGLSNSQRTALLEANLKFQPISINPDDAQSLETRKFQVEETARYYRMPLFMIGHTEKATTWGTGLEQIMRGYLSQTLGSWLTRWEQWVPFYLLDEAEQGQYYVEHLLADFLKADIKTRYEAYGMGVDKGWLNRNTVREFENLDAMPGPGGEVYTIQLAMANLEDVASGSIDNAMGLRALPNARQPLLPAASQWSFTDVRSGRGVTATEIEGARIEVRWQSPAGRFCTEILKVDARLEGGGLNLAATEQAELRVIERADSLAAQYRSLRARHRLRVRFREVFEQSFGRIVRRETAALRRLAKRIDSDGADSLSIEGFLAEVETFYELDALRNEREIEGHMAWLSREYLGPLTSYSDLIQDELLEERGEDELPEGAASEVVLAGYVTRFLRRHGARSENQLSRLAAAAEDAAAARLAIEGRLDEWDEKRAGKLAAEETVHASGSIARITYFALGVVSIEWVAAGENCPLCDELNGQVVGIQEVFLEKGDVVDPDDGETQPLETKRAILNPPLHLGCDCDVTAS